MSNSSYSLKTLTLDYQAEADKITKRIREIVSKDLKRRGVIVALSGGIDSTTVACLCVKALGKDRVFGLLMPEQDSSPDTLTLSKNLAESLEIDYAHEDITELLNAAGCYQRRDDAIREVIPEYGPGYKSKIVLPSVIADNQYRIFSIIAQTPDGKEIKARLTPKAYLGIVAATNFKQRIRKMLEYYHADRLNFATTGTPNRQEYDQGFFVKLGDGAADIKPIAHLYKTQVYEMARFLGAPEEICNRPPTTDTYSMPQSQEEFYFSVPYDKMDLCLYGKNNDIPINQVAAAVELTEEQVQRVYNDIDNKRNTTRYMHLPPILVQPVSEITH